MATPLMDAMTTPALDSADLTWLSSLARALLGEAHAADDLVQDVAVATIKRPIPAGVPRRAWLASTARRLAAQRYRGTARRADREALAAKPERLPDSTELVEKAEVAETIAAAARQLPEPYRRTILLRFLEGRSAAEIAREEGALPDTVRSRVRRGLALLREDLVRTSDRDWSSWCVLLVPLARSTGGEVGAAVAGASGGLSGILVVGASMKSVGTAAAAALALAAAGLWLIWEAGSGTPLDDVPVAEREVDDPPAVDDSAAGIVTPDQESQPDVGRVVETKPRVSAAAAMAGVLGGRVVDAKGDPIPRAKVFMVPITTKDAGAKDAGPLRALTESDESGQFTIARNEWQSLNDQPGLSFDLGAVANGYTRTMTRDVLNMAERDRLTIVLKRGASISGRVVDRKGKPIKGIDLLACPASEGIGHVSPSQSLLRSERKQFAWARSDYEHSRARTDRAGKVQFRGLAPRGSLRVISLDPGWTIVSPGTVKPGKRTVEWTAEPQLGVRLFVTERSTGMPVERAYAIFCVDVTFGDGERKDLSQWVGRGTGGASFVFDSEALPGLNERTITSARFYGTVRAGEGEAMEWSATALEDQNGVTGVADVFLTVDSRPRYPSPTGEDKPKTLERSAELILDARYGDGAPFKGTLEVTWRPRNHPAAGDRDFVAPDRNGVYRMNLIPGRTTLQVSDRNSYGALMTWTGEIDCVGGRSSTVAVTLDRGGTAIIVKPSGWRGEWFVDAKWRAVGSGDEWVDAFGLSTAERKLDLRAMKPGEWRFALRRKSGLAPNPRIVEGVVRAGLKVKLK